MNAASIIAIIAAVLGLAVSLGTIIFKLGVANGKLLELVKAQGIMQEEIAGLKKEVSGLKLKLVGRVEGLRFD